MPTIVVNEIGTHYKLSWSTSSTNFVSDSIKYLESHNATSHTLIKPIKTRPTLTVFNAHAILQRDRCAVQTGVIHDSHFFCFRR